MNLLGVFTVIAAATIFVISVLGILFTIAAIIVAHGEPNE